MFKSVYFGAAISMTHDDPTDRSHIPLDLVELGTFEGPQRVARQTLGHLFEKMRSRLMPQVRHDALDLAALDTEALGQQVLVRGHDRLEGILCNQLDRRFLAGSREGSGRPVRQAFVHPPMAADPLTTWARGHGLEVVEDLDDFEKASRNALLIVPRIERFFTRDVARLASAQHLFDALQRHNGPALVGCNSWTWRQFKQRDAVPLLFEKEWTVPAFDADALATLLLHTADGIHAAKSAASGAAVFERDGDGALKDPYFQNLRGRSLGLPWVAIEMFAMCAGEGMIDETGEKGIWVSLPDPLPLSTSDSPMLAFALHSLLVHGPRTVEELSHLMPGPAPRGLWDRLVRDGFVEIDNGVARCVLAHYPSIRSELGAAGFNLDKM